MWRASSVIEPENQVAALQQRVPELSAAMQQREAQVRASYRRDPVPYTDVQQASAPVVGRPKRDG